MSNNKLNPSLRVDLILLFAKHNIFGDIEINVKTLSKIRKIGFTVSVDDVRLDHNTIESKPQ